MGLHVVYVQPDEADPVIDGDRIASAKGWLDWSDWAAELGEQYPECHYLAEYGEIEDPAVLLDLEHELERLLHEPEGTVDQRAVTARLLELLRDRPDGTIGVIVTTGEAGGGDGPDDEPPDEE